ncbi:MAG: DUF3782 domain-containing protein [Methylococcaceae bacterium]|nr:MAG: DUF3782 domain-containing protein [Methylococcaceae bacterium]
MAATREELRHLIKHELPALMRDDAEIRENILRYSRDQFAGKRQTEDRFEKMLAEIIRQREVQEQKWEANQAELARIREEQKQKWDTNQAELARMREEQKQKWDTNQAELARMHEEDMQKWKANEEKWKAHQAELARMHEENRQKWEAQEQRWWANQEELKRMNQALESRIDRSIGALGARWGIKSETAFRDALAAILEKSFNAEVVNVTEWDSDGMVFGKPDQVEIDVIIKNGLLIVCELKSSLSKSDLLTFHRKALFYEQLQGRKADRLLAISPMIDDRARREGERLGIEMYGDSVDVKKI